VKSGYCYRPAKKAFEANAAECVAGGICIVLLSLLRPSTSISASPNPDIGLVAQLLYTPNTPEYQLPQRSH
jgi:hypothetical protein